MSFKIPNGHYIIYTDGSEQGFINTIFLYWAFLLHQREQKSFNIFLDDILDNIKMGDGDENIIDYLDLYKNSVSVCLSIDYLDILCGYCHKEYFIKSNKYKKYTEIRYDDFINKYDLDILFPLHSFYETTKKTLYKF